MASLQEAFGCSFSETPFEVIDDNFRLDGISEINDPEPIKNEKPIINNRRQHQIDCDNIQLHLMKCPICRERNNQEYTNILLLITIGMLLFIILEKRLK